MNRKLRVWHIPNIPGPVFYQRVRSLKEALLVLQSLARYDLYLGELIHTNAQGLQAYVDGEWCEWHDSAGDDIQALVARQPPDEVVRPREWRARVGSMLASYVVSSEDPPDKREAKRKKEETRKRISEGTRRGLAATTKRGGRPTATIPLQKLERVRRGKLTVQALADEVGCQPITIRRHLSRLFPKT